ncbi:SDR family oxidoreductase [Rhizobium sp. P28RR-XV]|uniref:SDR family oxidoreductase n=1 Tax=Rhizobium sp. P28RR-XV TaxID=2726737 RepID=UPI001456F5AD|nr:SDR family oxidoreductase [Rhizobium sp. P28RR-XV]NLR86367.1 SDR family oxidoreductase [Rhizobium sp. P28RR-XV]
MSSCRRDRSAKVRRQRFPLADVKIFLFRIRGLDVLRANAGGAFGTPLTATEEARYDELMDINVKGVFFSMQAVSPILREGALVILSMSWLNKVGTPGLSMLSASKAAVRSLARTWSAELLDRKIRVNTVSPGAVARQSTAVPSPRGCKRQTLCR